MEEHLRIRSFQHKSIHQMPARLFLLQISARTMESERSGTMSSAREGPGAAVTPLGSD